MFRIFSMVKSWPGDICLHVFIISYMQNARLGVSEVLGILGMFGMT